MAIDLKQSWSDASSKVSSIKTTKETKDNEKTLRKNKANSSKDNNSNNFKKQLSDAKSGKKNNKKQIKSEEKNQLELLLELFKESLPKDGNSGSLSTVTSIFLKAANETKNEIGDVLVDEIISTIGCSEEQSYDTTVNQPIYIKVSQIDLFKQLKTSPDDETGKFLYEDSQTNNGNLPYAMNRQLYKRLETPNQSFSQDTNAGNGQTYVSASQSQLFDIEYVQNYTNNQNVLVQGDFYKVTLNSQANNRTTVSDFLRDYYTSIDIMSFNNLSTNIKNSLSGSIDGGLDMSVDEIKQQSKFMLVLKRLMGVCSDPSKKIDVAGTAKLSDIDLVDDAFFEPTNQEDALSDMVANKVKKGVVDFEDCGNVELPVNLKSDQLSLQGIFNEKNDTKKIELLEKSIDDMSKDPNWKKTLDQSKLGLPKPSLNIKAALQTSIITKLPMTIFKTVMSPKVMLGFLIMVKSTKNELSETLDSKYDNLENFTKTFKKFVTNFLRKVYAIFVEKLFKIVKASIKVLVESILTEIIKETKIKQLKMISTIVYILLTLGQAFIDYRNCKSVIDEILKLLNLSLTSINLGLPPFILASAALLGGVSDTRATSNVIENLQKAGLPTGAAPDGGPNLMNVAISSIIKGQNEEVAANGKTQIFVPPLVVTPAGVTLPTTANGKSY
jgi:hypothetical protein